MYKVYCISSKTHYNGFSFVSADSADEANAFINDFKQIDNQNTCDSWGYDAVCEHDVVEHLFADHKGIIFYGIYYRG